MKRPLLLIAMLLLAAAMLQGCGDGTEQAQEEEVVSEETLAASVDDWSITREFLQNYINSMTESQKRRFDTHEGRAAVAGQMIEEELFYREARKSDLIEDPWVKAQLDEATRRILIQGYFRNFVTPEAEPLEQELHDYYEAHEDVYTTLAVCRAQHIFAKKKEKLDDLKIRIVEGGEKFTTMAHNYSEDKLTAPEGGNLGFFNPGGYIRGVGFDEAFSDTLFQLQEGMVHGPIKWSKGYSLVYVNERRPPELKPYGEVRDEIRDVLMRDRLENARDEVVQQILETSGYEVKNYMHEFYMSIQRNPEELWSLAQNADDPQDRLRSFREIVNKFPSNEYAPQAMFMVGFVYAEELYDYVTADRTFTDLVNRYPDSEYADMARWMIDNMGKDAPSFEDMEDVNRLMNEDS